MPIPKPRKGESQNNFISRCAGNDTMVEEYPDQKQRVGICFSTWRRRNLSETDEHINKIVSEGVKRVDESHGIKVTFDGKIEKEVEDV